MSPFTTHANDNDNDSSASLPLRFVSQAVIERLRSGQFVPKRNNVVEANPAERRNSLSPLAICKRCIAYQPAVFKDRHALVWQLLEGLNSPYTKLLLITGKLGSGKTSLLRAVTELMGGGKEQLVWFEISAYASALSLCETLLRQLVFMLETQQPTEQGAHPKDPIQLQSSYDREKTFQRLAPLMAKSSHLPILLVLDDIDPFVSMQERLEAPVLKETFNFLLAQPNIKIAIASKRQPYADLKAPPQSILELHLERFDSTIVEKIIDRTKPKLENNPALEGLFSGLAKASQGHPWLVQLICQLLKNCPDALITLDLEYQQRLNQYKRQHPFETTLETHLLLVDALANWLLQLPKTQEERLLLMVLSFIRHPIDEQVMKALLPHSLATFMQWIKQPAIKPFLRRQAEPQTIFNTLVAQRETTTTTKSSSSKSAPTAVLFELFPAIGKSIIEQLSTQDRLSWHEQLDKFYTEQADLFPQQRVFANSDTLTLSREARAHRDKALALTQTPATVVSAENTPSQTGYSTPLLNRQSVGGTTALVEAEAPKAATKPEPLPEAVVKKQAEPPIVQLKPQVDEVPLLNQIKEAKAQQQAATYFQTLLALATHRGAKHRLAEAHKALETFQNSLTENTLIAQLTPVQITTFQAQGYQLAGELFIQENQLSKAVSALKQALSCWQTTEASQPEKSRFAQVTVQYALMNLLVQQQKTSLALPFAEAILQLFPVEQTVLLQGIEPTDQQAVVQFQAESLAFQAKHQLHWQQPKVLEALKQAYHLFLTVKHFAAASQQLSAMAKLFWEKGDLTKTKHCLTRAIQLDASHQVWAVMLQNQLDFALLAWEEGYGQEAFATLEQLLGLSQAQQLPLWQVKALIAMADVVADQAGTLMQQKLYLQQAYQIGQGCLSAKGLQTLALRLEGLTGQLLTQSAE